MFSRRLLAASVGLLPLAQCLAAPGCIASSAHPPAPHSAITSQITVATPSPSLAPSAATVASQPSNAAPGPFAEHVPPPCTATVRAEVHLRPRRVPQSMGAALPEGTTFDVFGVDLEVRRTIPGDEDEGVLAHVRVAGNGPTGWAFVRYTEFAPACPILIDTPRWMARTPSPPTERADCSRAPDHGEQLWYAERGPRRFRPQILRCCLGPEHWQVIERADVDGDGVGDEVVQADRSCLCLAQELSTSDEDGAVVALMRRAGGWLGADVVRIASASRGSHPSSQYLGTIHAGAAVYFREEYEEGTTSDEWVGLPTRVRLNRFHTLLRRIDPCGVPRIVATLFPPLAGGCSWTGNADGSVEISCRRPSKRARLRWDEARFELVSDAPAMPHADSD